MSKVVFITGGTSGIGEAIATVFSRRNYMVYSGGRNVHNRKNCKNLKYIPVDVTNDNSVDKAINLIVSENDGIDILINCAGVGVAAAIEEIPIEKIKQAFDVNLFGSIRTIKAVTPHMRKQGNGLIINISSIAGQVGLPFQGVYSSTKFALEGITEALRIELKPFGINTCLVEPGDYKTKVNQNRITTYPNQDSPYSKRLTSFFKIINNNIEKGRNPEKLANLIFRIANSKNPRLRYRSGKLFEKITPFVHRVTPPDLFGKMLEKFYKL